MVVGEGECVRTARRVRDLELDFWNILTAIRTMHQPWYHIIYHSVVPIVVVEVEPQDSAAVQADAAGSA